MPPANEQQDSFFLWGMVFLPIVSLCAYVFDAYYYYYYTALQSNSSIYEGLLSTILIVFAYLQYCAPIESRSWRFVYHVLLWLLIETGHIGYFLAFIHQGKTYSAVIFVGWMILDIVFTLAILYCRVRLDKHPLIEVENRHIFHFISRLEVILAIFIPIFVSQEYSTITRDNIAFFLLFDFFSEEYKRFNGAWIKSCLYLFVLFVTASVATEWLYFRFESHTYEYITEAAELIAASFCYTLIIMQFFQRHFRQRPLIDDAQLRQIRISDMRPIIMRF